MKPQAAKEYRGPHEVMRSANPDLEVNSRLPRTASVMDKVTIIRSVHHKMTNHNSAAYYALTGKAPPTDDQRLRDSLDLFPAYGSVVDKFLPHRDPDRHRTTVRTSVGPLGPAARGPTSTTEQHHP